MLRNKEIVYTKEKYIRLIPPFTESEYERLRRSIKQAGRLYLPVILNQDNVVLDAPLWLRACQELNIPVLSNLDFTGRPIDEMIYVIDNLQRRNLNEFQRANQYHLISYINSI